MRTVFILNNLKVNPFILNDAPLPGFDLLAWEHECSVKGTLWDIGYDAGYTFIGNTDVKGQLWIAETVSAVKELEEFVGVNSGLTEPMKVKVEITPEPLIKEVVDAVVYKLTKIKNEYKIVHTGNWMLKRTQDKFVL